QVPARSRPHLPSIHAPEESTMTPTSSIAANLPPPKKAHERYFDDVQLGDEGTTPEVTVTKEMIRAYADLTGDQTPVHVDEEFANASHFGGIDAHGRFGLSRAD